MLCDSVGLEPRPNNGTLRLPLQPTGQHQSEDTPPELADPEPSTRLPAKVEPTIDASATPSAAQSAEGEHSEITSPTPSTEPSESEENEEGDDDQDGDDKSHHGLTGSIEDALDWVTGELEDLWDKISGSHKDKGSQSS